MAVAYPVETGISASSQLLGLLVRFCACAPLLVLFTPDRPYEGVLTLLAFVAGVGCGVARGRRRDSFLPRRAAVDGGGVAVGTVIVAVILAWVFSLGWGLGYPVGRVLRPGRRTLAARQARDDVRARAWTTSLALYRHLAAGGELPIGPPSDVLVPGPVHLDVEMQYARYCGQDVWYREGSILAMGSTGFVLGATLAQGLLNVSARRRAEALAAAQWREVQSSRVVVTGDATWCRTVAGTWLEFSHLAVREYRVDDTAVVMTFSDAAPLMLAGAHTWTHAVVFARLRYGYDWQQAPWLAPLAG